jgi:hypothetical protein
VSTINLGEHQGDGIRYSMHLSAPAGGAAQMLRDPAGNWVGYADYAALQAEVDSIRHTAFSIGLLQDKLRQKCEDYHHAMISNQNNVMLLKKSMRENERLRKAGDALAKAAEQSAYHKEDYNVIKAWLAAKESQP